jgi:ssDNA-binding replication factor A large subunit
MNSNSRVVSTVCHFKADGGESKKIGFSGLMTPTYNSGIMNLQVAIGGYWGAVGTPEYLEVKIYNAKFTVTL